MPLASQAVRSRTTSQWSVEMQKTARFFTEAQSSTFANTFNEARSVYASDRWCLIWEVSLTHEDQFHCRQPSSFFPAGDDGIYGCVRCKVRAMRKWTNSKCHAHTLRFDQSFCGVVSWGSAGATGGTFFSSFVIGIQVSDRQLQKEATQHSSAFQRRTTRTPISLSPCE